MPLGGRDHHPAPGARVVRDSRRPRFLVGSGRSFALLIPVRLASPGPSFARRVGALSSTALHGPRPYIHLSANGMRTKRPRVKTADLNIRITPKLKEAARKAAEMDQRTLSSLIERLLTEHCHEVGTLKRRSRA
jgi:hypothetical protein